MAALPTNRTTANTAGEHVSDHNTLHGTHNRVETMGVLGRAVSTTLSQTVTAGVDVTDMTTTVTVAANRILRITGHIRMSASSAAGSSASLTVRESSTDLGCDCHGFAVSAANEDFTVVTIVVAPSAGSHTYKLFAVRSQGSATITGSGSATIPAFIVVEDIGPSA